MTTAAETKAGTSPKTLALVLVRGTGGLFVLGRWDGSNVVDLAAERDRRRSNTQAGDNASP